MPVPQNHNQLSLPDTISFIIPAYNEERYIEKSLSSIFKELGRGRYNAEVIVVDNASTDKTKDRALSFPGVRVVDESRKGITWARQAGFLVSSGDIIFHLDADTLLPEGWIENALKEFSKNPNLVALSSGPLIYYDVSKSVNFTVYMYYSFAYVLYLSNLLLKQNCSILQGGNAVIRRSGLEKINGYNTEYIFYGEDADLGRRLGKVGKVKFTLRFPTHTSGRRLAREGVLTMGTRYVLNYIWTNLFKKPFTKTVFDISEK